MNCEHVRLLLYLNRNEERTPEENATVAAHLPVCSACAAEAARITELCRQIRESVRREPIRRYRMTLVDDVMAHIAIRPKTVDRGLRWLSSRTQVMQYALGGTLAALCIFFNAQTLYDAKRLELLEQRTGQIRPRPRVTEALSAGMYELSGRTDVQTFHIALSRSSHADGERPQPLIDYWRKKYPHLASLRVTDNPTEEDRRILATEGAAMVRELMQWINNGGRQ